MYGYYLIHSAYLHIESYNRWAAGVVVRFLNVSVEAVCAGGDRQVARRNVRDDPASRVVGRSGERGAGLRVHYGYARIGNDGSGRVNDHATDLAGRQRRHPVVFVAGWTGVGDSANGL